MHHIRWWLVALAFVAFGSPWIAEAASSPPPILNKTGEDCCGDQDCRDAEVRIGAWNVASKKYAVEVNGVTIFLPYELVGYSTRKGRYCFKSGVSTCWERPGVPKVDADCVRCAVELRKTPFAFLPKGGPAPREILIRDYPGAGALATHSFLMPVVPYAACAACHSGEDKKALLVRTRHQIGWAPE